MVFYSPSVVTALAVKDELTLNLYFRVSYVSFANIGFYLPLPSH